MQGHVAHEGDRVDQPVGDDERGHPPPPVEQDAEHHAHRGVAEKPAEPLVEVVRPAEHRAEDDRMGRCPAELIQPAQQVPEDHDLFQDPVLQPLEDEHRDPPPHRGQALRDHVEADPKVERRDVEAEAQPADDRGQGGAPGQVAGGPGRVQAHG